ncbi:unnamed protein product [Tuwongella immobilis]|uniref:Uncharacterized protein n=1 Tax=Tuwongella immobilis TaxID=692036 RepID=A0A6C2YWM5_9BACT|nr:unnamed protein product [Tuwongella immobilis]VTS08938.1 unnamed protein product [Tuwongella immobilis]
MLRQREMLRAMTRESSESLDRSERFSLECESLERLSQLELSLDCESSRRLERDTP